MAIGLLFPYAWIVATGEGRTSEEHTIEKSVAEKMTPGQIEKYMKESSRPMTFSERAESAVFVAEDQWRWYLSVSVNVGLVVFLVNYIVWSSRAKEL